METFSCGNNHKCPYVFRPCRWSETEDQGNRKLNKNGKNRRILHQTALLTYLDLNWIELSFSFSEKELAKVTIKKEDVELIVSYFALLPQIDFGSTT